MAEAMVSYGTRACAECGASYIARSSTSKSCSPGCAKVLKKKWSAAYHVANRERVAERTKAWAALNPERMRERSRRYEALHKDERRGRKRDSDIQARTWQRWYAENRERVLIQTAKRYRENPKLRHLGQSRRRARVYGVGSHSVKPADLRRLALQSGGMCTYCRAAPGEHWDHRVPLARGGSHSVGNLTLACAACNQQKHTKTVTEWRIWRTRIGLADLPPLTLL